MTKDSMDVINDRSLVFPKGAEKSTRMSNFPLVTTANRGLNRYFMRIWKMTAVVALGFSSFAADNVAPTRAELEEMYNGAYKAFDAKKFFGALKQLDAIDGAPA